MINQRQIDIISTAHAALEPLVTALQVAGFQARMSSQPAEDRMPDLVLLDVAHWDGWPFVDDIAAGRVVLMVADASAMRRGFALGAEDCVLAGAHVDEIVARCEAVLRRTTEPSEVLAEEPAVYVDRRLWVNFDSRQVWVGGRPAQLTPREFRLLQFLILHHDSTLGHEQILEAVWERPPDSERPTEVLKQYIWRLRQKVEDNPNQPATIVTEQGAGYRFVAYTN